MYLKGLSDLEGTVAIRKYLENSSKLKYNQWIAARTTQEDLLGESLIEELYRGSGYAQRSVEVV